MTETRRRTRARPHFFRHRAVPVAGAALAFASSPVAAASGDGPFDPWLSLCLVTKPPLTPETVWSSWSFAPEIVVPLLALLGWYIWRVAPQVETRRAGRAGAFTAGWLLLALALTSPLCRAAATLASAHMVQHAVLVALAPPLLVLGLPQRVLGRPMARIASARWSVSLGLAYAAVIWLAHAPVIYEAALSGWAAHLALIVVLLGTSCAFWAVALGDPRSGAACASGAALCFIAMLQTGLLGALLTFASIAWYPLLAVRAAAWDVDAVTDQQLAGLIMWIPMSAIYIAGCLVLTARWLQLAETPAAGPRAAAAS